MDQLSLLPSPRTHDGVPMGAEDMAKDRGQRRAESANWRNVQIARDIARDLALGGIREVSADDVRRRLRADHPDITPGNWMGSVFRRSEWDPVGFVKSTTPGSHSNRLVAWKLRYREDM